MKNRIIFRLMLALSIQISMCASAQEYSADHFQNIESSRAQNAMNHLHKSSHKNSRNTSQIFGSFFRQAQELVSPGNAITFTSVGFASGIELLPNGLIQVQKNGDYLIVFGVIAATAVAEGGATRVALKNGNVIVPGTNLSIPSFPGGRTVQTVSTIVQVQNAPTTFSVINNDTRVLNLISELDTDTDAFINIQRLPDTFSKRI